MKRKIIENRRKKAGEVLKTVGVSKYAAKRLQRVNLKNENSEENGNGNV